MRHSSGFSSRRHLSLSAPSPPPAGHCQRAHSHAVPTWSRNFCAPFYILIQHRESIRTDGMPKQSDSIIQSHPSKYKTSRKDQAPVHPLTPLQCHVIVPMNRTPPCRLNAKRGIMTCSRQAPKRFHYQIPKTTLDTLYMQAFMWSFSYSARSLRGSRSWRGAREEISDFVGGMMGCYERWFRSCFFLFVTSSRRPLGLGSLCQRSCGFCREQGIQASWPTGLAVVRKMRLNRSSI